MIIVNIYLSFLFNLNFGLANGVFFNILNELLIPPSCGIFEDFSINPLYACLASSVKHPCAIANEGNIWEDDGIKGNNKK